ncbi:Uncharacterized protein HZ326_20306 [Fusarium oxysporum f. sp. albedinis]|nr:Uncharacterized protein HZ326_20306 [Fusarium oxysporum f. sp. albedinis]
MIVSQRRQATTHRQTTTGTDNMELGQADLSEPSPTRQQQGGGQILLLTSHAPHYSYAYLALLLSRSLTPVRIS